MKLIKKLSAGLALTLALTATGTYFLPVAYHAQCSVYINTHPGNIYPFVSNFELWPLWAPFNKDTDPSMVFYYSGPASGVGSAQTWNGNKEGKGQMVVVESHANQQLCYDLQQYSGKMAGTGTFTFEATGNGTIVSWRTDAVAGNNPLGKLQAILQASLLRSQLEQGLISLKATAEQSLTAAQRK